MPAIAETMTGRNTFRLFLMLIIALLGYYLATLIIDSPNPTDSHVNGDARKYWHVAGNMLETGRHFEVRDQLIHEWVSWRPPVTSFLLATLRHLGFTLNNILYAYWALILLTTVVLWMAAREFLKDRDFHLKQYALLIPPLTYLAHLQVFKASRVVSAEIPFLFLQSTLIYLLCRAMRSDRPLANRLIFFSGVIYGTLMLSRTVVIAFLPGLLLLVGVCSRSNHARFRALNVRSIFIFIAGSLLIITPWQLRNASYHDGFTFISSSSGYNLYKGVYSDGTVESAREIFQYVSSLPPMTESELDHHFSNEAKKYIADNPTIFVRGFLKKVKQLWIPRAGLAVKNVRFWYTLVLQSTWLAALIACFFVRKNRTELLAFASMAIGITILHGTVGAGSWFVLPLLVPCSLLVAYFISARFGQTGESPPN
jgi:hypothetical protein